MADDPTARDPQDRARVNVEQPHDVRYWSDKLRVSPEELRKAVEQVGSSADAVAQHLGSFR